MADADSQVECPRCGALLRVASDGAGREKACPVCRGTVRIGGTAEPRAAEAAPGEAPDTVGSFSLAGPAEPDQDAPAHACFAREGKVSPIALGRLVERYTGLDRLAARRHVVRCQGLLLEDLDFATASGVVAALQEEGCEAFAVPAQAVPSIEREVSLVRVYGADEEALRIQTDREGSVRSVRWPMLAAGICTLLEFDRRVETEEVRELGYGYYGAMAARGYALRSAHHTRRREVEPPLRVTLILRDEVGRAYVMMFVARQVRFAYLGDRMKAGREQNLQLLLEDVLRWGSHAFFPAGFRAAARGLTARVTKLLSKADEDRYLRWAMCCAAARGLFRPR